MKTHYPLKVCIVGGGSIGIRHANNCSSIVDSVTLVTSRPTAVIGKVNKNISVSSSLEKSISTCDLVIICNRTDAHISTALLAAEHHKHILIEKPISTSKEHIQNLQSLVNKNKLVCATAYMLRFHPTLSVLRDTIKKNIYGSTFSANLEVGQYLPYWRPSQDYTQGYASSYLYGGGVTFDLIHEIDAALWLFGFDNFDVSSFIASTGSLAIPTDDISHILLNFQGNPIVHLSLDYLRKSYKRRYEVLCQNATLDWDFTSGNLRISDEVQSYALLHSTEPGFDRNKMYVDEIKCFLASVMSGHLINPLASLAEGIVSLDIALSCLQNMPLYKSP